MALMHASVDASSPEQLDSAKTAEAYIDYHLEKYDALTSGAGCSALEPAMKADYMALKTVKNRILAFGETYYPAVDDCSRMVHDQIRSRLAGRAATKLGMDPRATYTLGVDWNNPDLPKLLKEHMHHSLNPANLGACAEDFPEKIIAVNLGKTAVLLDTGVDVLYGFVSADPIMPQDLTGIYYINRAEPSRVATWQVG